MSKIVKNNTDSEVTIGDLGITVPASGQRDLDNVSQHELCSSDDLVTLLGNETLTGNDGTQDLSISDSIHHFFGYLQKFSSTSDNKLIAQVTPRPIGQYTYMTGAGDDTALGIAGIGEGNELALDIPSYVDSTSVDIYINDGNDWSIREGYVAWKDGGWRNYIDFEIWCDPNTVIADATAAIQVTTVNNVIVPYPGSGYTVSNSDGNYYLLPSKTQEGYWNYDSVNGLTPASGDGAYQMLDIPYKLFRFAHKIWTVDSSQVYVRLVSNDAEKMSYGYYMKLVCFNTANVDYKVWGVLTTFRKTTV